MSICNVTCSIVDLQHYLMMISGMIIVPLYVATTVCLHNDWVATSYIFSTMLFICGITTLLQATVGSRSDSLPVLAIFLSILISRNNNSNARGCIEYRSRQNVDADSLTHAVHIAETTFHNVATDKLL